MSVITLQTLLRDGVATFRETQPKDAHMLTVSGSGSRIVTVYDQPIKLNPKRQYEMALLNLETYHSIPNVEETNNCLKYRKDGKSAWSMVKVPVGSYEIRAINAEIIRQVGNKSIEFKANLNTLQCILTITGTYEVDFTTENSIHTLLGFNDHVYTKGRHASENLVDILRVNSILVHTDIISGSYHQGKIVPIIYSFFPDASPGEKIIEKAQNIVYAHVTMDTISLMTTWLTDQDNKVIDLRGEELTIRYHIREC